jgi:hypothetical protein
MRSALDAHQVARLTLGGHTAFVEYVSATPKSAIRPRPLVYCPWCGARLEEPLQNMQGLPERGNVRALLMAFVEWLDRKDTVLAPGDYGVDVFLAQHEGERPQTGGPIPPQADLVVVFDDKTAEKRSDEEITELTRRLAEVAGSYGYDRHMWGTREQVMAVFRRQDDLPSTPATVATSSQSGEDGQAEPEPLTFTVVPEGSIQEKGRITPDGKLTCSGMTLDECITLARDGCVFLRCDPPHVKVTEVVGHLRWGAFPYNALWGTEAGKAGRSELPVCSLIPSEATSGAGEDGPRGRFRVTVEFWPEGG